MRRNDVRGAKLVEPISGKGNNDLLFVLSQGRLERVKFYSRVLLYYQPPMPDIDRNDYEHFAISLESPRVNKAGPPAYR
jgi:hypothetical protein